MLRATHRVAFVTHERVAARSLKTPLGGSPSLQPMTVLKALRVPELLQPQAPGLQGESPGGAGDCRESSSRLGARREAPASSRGEGG